MVREFRIKVDHNKCVGSRICTAVAPTKFQLNAEGQAVPTTSQNCNLKLIQTAAEACPVGAIEVETLDETKRES